MKRIYYIIQSDRDSTGAALYIVRVGKSDPKQRTSASIKRAASRARDQVNLIIKSRANAGHVKNLSPQFLRRAKLELIQTHKLLLCENF